MDRGLGGGTGMLDYMDSNMIIPDVFDEEESCNCDDIVVFEDGRIVERGNHEELLERRGSMRKCGTLRRNIM